MRKLIAIALLLAVPFTAAFARATLSGKIKDAATGESIPAVAVVVEGANRGAAANVEGFFSLPNLEDGEYTLVFTSLGYETLRLPVTIQDGKNQNVEVKLRDQALQFREVQIIAQRDNQPTYAPKVAQIEVTPRELLKLPQLAEPDLFRALQATAGILPSSDFSAELNIWGGSGDQNLILLNGINVYKPTHLGGLFSIFNMDAVKDVKLIKGGFGAQYGGRLSAVVDVADREGNRNEVEGKVGLSLLSSTATLEGPIKPWGSWLVAGRRTYIDAATKLFKNMDIIEDEFPYYFYDFNAKITRDFPNGDRFSPSGYWGDDILQLTSATGDRLRLKWGNRTFSAPFVHIFSPKVYSHTTVAGSKFYGRQRFETSDSWFEWNNEITDVTAETDFTYFANARSTFGFGAEAKFFDAFLEGISSDYLFGHNDYKGNLLSIYAMDDYRLTDKWTISPGLRFEHYSITNTQEVVPRLAARRDLGPGMYVSGAWGLYTQYLQQMRVGNQESLFDSYAPLSDRFGIARGQQYALSFVDDSLGRFKLSGGVYYKKFQNIAQLDLFEAKDDGDTDLEDVVRMGRGYAYGMDFTIGGSFGAYDMSWGYGWGRTRRVFDDFEGFKAVDNGLSFPAFFDRQHNTNIFLSRKVRNRGSLEARLNYQSGLPYTKPEGAYSPGLDLPPHYFQQGRTFGERFDAYVRLDVAYRLKYEWNWCTFAPYFEIINVLGRKNPLTLSPDFTTNPVGIETVGQLPFLPTLGFTAEF